MILDSIVFSTLPFFFFFNDTAPTEIYTLSLHDALPISARCSRRCVLAPRAFVSTARAVSAAPKSRAWNGIAKAACRCIRCAPISITGWRPRSPRSAPAASRSGSSRAKSLSTTRWPRTRKWPRATVRGPVATLLKAFLRRFEGVSHDATKENEVPEGAQGPDPRRCDFGRDVVVRSVRPESDGARAHHRTSDRSRTACADPSHEARRPRLDPDFPGFASVEEARRSAHGLGQGHAGIVGSAGEARPRDLRNRRRDRADRERSADARRRQVADQDALRSAHRGV